MSYRNFIIFAVITALLVVAAVVGVANRQAPSAIAAVNESAFPGLDSKLNEVAALEITDADGTFTLQKTGRDWVFVERGGYPVPFTKVKTTLVALAKLNLLERKTSDPKRLGRLHLDDYKSKGSKSKLIKVKGAGGKILAAAVIGRRNFDLFGKRGAGTYMRRDGEDQSWLAAGDVEISTVASSWVDSAIIDIAEDRVQKAVVTHPDGKQVIVGKNTAEDNSFILRNLPKGREVKASYEVNGVGRALANLKLEDVRKADTLPFDKDAVTLAYSTFTGLVVRGDIIKYKDEYWGRFVAEGGATAPDAKAVKPDAKPDAKKESESLAQQAARINARVGGWAYRIPFSRAEDLTRKLTAMLKPLESEKKTAPAKP